MKFLVSVIITVIFGCFAYHFVPVMPLVIIICIFFFVFFYLIFSLINLPFDLVDRAQDRADEREERMIEEMKTFAEMDNNSDEYNTYIIQDNRQVHIHTDVSTKTKRN